MAEGQPGRAEVADETVGLAAGIPADRPAAGPEPTRRSDAELNAVVDFLLSEPAPQDHGPPDDGPDAPPPPGDSDVSTREAGVLTLPARAGTPHPRRIDRYKLLHPLGEGGFGAVYLAEQLHPIERRVAVKIVKAGMDTKQVIARFEAERQALAMMDHPGIAKVFDAGQTPEGRPFFVMELVRGVPMTDYCDRHGLTVPQRLELFVQVCHAVQHAHQKGIIHRDLKPANVLISHQDGKPVPKVIDFGIAKATQTRLTEKTLFTELRQLIGTPEYMPPEQAETSGLDVDTRADIYSLGVLLYELLTGVTPFAAEALHKKSFAEIQRIIAEVEPPKPSTRLRASGDGLAAVAARRHTDPRRLPPMVRGELDWIVMKCLEKDRTRRYDAASALARDVERHLRGEAVLARPTTTTYRLRKFVARHRIGVAAAAVVAAAVLAGAGLAGAGLLHARRAHAETLTAFRMLRELLQNDSTVPPFVDEAIKRLDAGWLRDEPDTAATLRSAIGTRYLGSEPERAERQFTAALALLRPANGTYPPSAVDALAGLAAVAVRRGDADGADARINQAIAAIDAGGGDVVRDFNAALGTLLKARAALGNRDAAREIARREAQWRLRAYAAALKQGEGNEQTRADRGRLLASLGPDRFAEAATDLRVLIDRNPTQLSPRLLLAYIELYLGNVEAGRGQARQLLDTVSAAPEHLDRLEVARLCLVSDAYVGRLADLQKLLERAPDPPPQSPDGAKWLVVWCLWYYRSGMYARSPPVLDEYLMNSRPGPNPQAQERPLAQMLMALHEKHSGSPHWRWWYDAARNDARAPMWREPETERIVALPAYLAFELLKRELETAK